MVGHIFNTGSMARTRFRKNRVVLDLGAISRTYNLQKIYQNRSGPNFLSLEVLVLGPRTAFRIPSLHYAEA
jgi:hypothetical protein